MSNDNQEKGCEYCNHPQYAGTQCKNCGRVTQPADDNDFPLGPACDLSGEGTCEACQ